MLDGLFPEAVVTAEAVPSPKDEAALFPAERDLIARAVERRRLEFATGRACARTALGRLGIEEAPLLNDADRAPIWPEGIVGSVSHTRGYCAVAVARRGHVRSVGLDVEVDEAVKPRLWERICTDSERAWIASQPEAERGLLVRAIFSAKEAFYKCQFPVTRTFLGFSAARVELSPGVGSFVVELLRDAGDFEEGHRFEGRLARGDGYVRTAMTWTQ